MTQCQMMDHFMNYIYTGCDFSILEISLMSQNVSHLNQFEQISAWITKIFKVKITKSSGYNSLLGIQTDNSRSKSQLVK